MKVILPYIMQSLDNHKLDLDTALLAKILQGTTIASCDKAP